MKPDLYPYIACCHIQVIVHSGPHNLVDKNIGIDYMVIVSSISTLSNVFISRKKK